jgi:hypothetical protein
LFVLDFDLKSPLIFTDAQHQIKEELITIRDLQRFREARLINATTDMKNNVPIAIENIGW